MTHFSADHLLLARRRRALIGRMSRVELLIAQVTPCSDFRDHVLIAHNRIGRLAWCMAKATAGAAAAWMLPCCCFIRHCPPGASCCMLDGKSYLPS